MKNACFISLLTVAFMCSSESIFSQTNMQVQRSDQTSQLTHEDVQNKQSLATNLLSFLDSSGLLTYINERKFGLGATAATIATVFAGYLIFAAKKVDRVGETHEMAAGWPLENRIKICDAFMLFLSVDEIRRLLHVAAQPGGQVGGLSPATVEHLKTFFSGLNPLEFAQLMSDTAYIPGVKSVLTTFLALSREV